MKGTVAHMEEETKTLLEILGIASLGGVVDYIRHQNGKFKPVELALSIIVAAFAGMEAHFIVAWLELGINLQFAVAGIAGYGGGVLLDTAVNIARQIMHSRAGTKAEETKREGGGAA